MTVHGMDGRHGYLVVPLSATCCECLHGWWWSHVHVCESCVVRVRAVFVCPCPHTHTPTITSLSFFPLKSGNWFSNPGLKNFLSLPFSVRPRIREELSLAKTTQTGNRAVTLHRVAVQVLSQRQKLVSRLGPQGLDHSAVVKLPKDDEVCLKVYDCAQ